VLLLPVTLVDRNLASPLPKFTDSMPSRNADADLLHYCGCIGNTDGIIGGPVCHTSMYCIPSDKDPALIR